MLNTIIHFCFCFHTFPNIFTILSSRYSVFQFQSKVNNSYFWLKFIQKIGFRFGILEDNYQNKNQDPQDLGSEFQKTNVVIRISILEILCLLIFGQGERRTLNFSTQIYPKMALGLEIQKTNARMKMSILEIPCVPILWQNEHFFTFSA